MMPDVMIHDDPWLEDGSLLSTEEEKILFIFKILKSWLESVFNTCFIVHFSIIIALFDRSNGFLIPSPV